MIKLDNDNKIKKVVMCSGKIYFELIDRIEEKKIKNIVIIRLEQIYPFPYENFKDELANFKNMEIVWCQEEPKNMGAWGFVRSRIQNVMKDIGIKQEYLYYVGRSASAPPATGIADRHSINQTNIVKLALEGDIKEVKENWPGVSQIRGKLPIE